MTRSRSISNINDENIETQKNDEKRFSLTEDYRQAKMTASRLDSINVDR